MCTFTWYVDIHLIYALLKRSFNTLLQTNSTSQMFSIIVSIQFMFCLTIQLFISCNYGSILTEKSNELSRAIYNCDWTEQSSEFKRIMLIFVERNQKPIIPRAGSLFDVGLPTFVRV